MKIQENKETNEFTIKPESKDERTVLKLILSICHGYPKRELDEIRRDYDKMPHCMHHHGLGHEIKCPSCNGTVNGAVNYKCGLPRDHEGEHVYILNWEESDGMNVWDPRESNRIVTD